MNRFSEKYIITKDMEWEELGGGVSRKFLGYDIHINIFTPRLPIVSQVNSNLKLMGSSKLWKQVMGSILNLIYCTVLFAWKRESLLTPSAL